MITVSNVSKKYRKKLAVDDLSFEVSPGKVTGFLGPNGAGKSTTMRLMLGLDKGPGSTKFDNKPLNRHEQPSRVVGFVLEAKAFHPTRSARNHLKVLAAAGGIPGSRVNEVLEIVGISDVAKKGPGKFSLGMSQRLSIAAALLGKPKYLILDEPANGLDPEGIAWLRKFIREYAKQGNGVLVSSHQLSEISQVADNVVVIAKGKLVTEAPVDKLTAKSRADVYVRVDTPGKLETQLKKVKLKYQKSGKGFRIIGSNSESIGKMAKTAGVTVFELRSEAATLEEAFLELTEDKTEYKAQDAKGRKWFRH